MTFISSLVRRATCVAAAVPILAFAAGDAGQPPSYALRLPVTLAPDAPLQRLVLPAQALVQLQGAGYSDVRLFNAQGQAVPMALATAAALTQTQRQQVRLPAYPILGAAGMTVGGAAGMDGMSLRIEERNGRRVVQVHTGTRSPGAGSGAAPTVLGALLDAREVAMPVASLALDVDLPNAQPTTFYVQASKDLKNWRAVGDAVLYRAEGATDLGASSIDMASADVKDQYLRITWSAAEGVTLRGATLTTSSSSRGARVSATLAAPALASPHELGFALPFATPVAALSLQPQGTNVLVPVRVLGRNDRSQPWTLLASSVVYRLSTAGKEQLSGPIELPGTAWRELRVEADAKTPGFAVAPAVTLQFEPAQIVFLASGPAPFILAAGLGGAAASYLPVQSLLPGYREGQENTLPLARVDGAAVATVTAQPAGDAVPTRSLVLWGVLLVGALALALMAWVLMKQGRQRPPTNT
ncbi:MAG: hypothetical protein JWQ72_3042 [Polaromonas sp.]|nr:hypothetical protein [Polaromonas sp.]